MPARGWERPDKNTVTHSPCPEAPSARPEGAPFGAPPRSMAVNTSGPRTWATERNRGNRHGHVDSVRHLKAASQGLPAAAEVAAAPGSLCRGCRGDGLKRPDAALQVR